MNEIWQPPPPNLVRGVHTRLGVPHEADIEVDPGLEQVFKVRTHVCHTCNEYCTDKTVQFLEPKGEEANMTDTYPVGPPKDPTPPPTPPEPRPPLPPQN